MDSTHAGRDTVGNEERCTCSKGEGRGVCYVLMHSHQYGTEVWPCDGLDEAIDTLSRWARSAERQRHEDGIQRFFCIKGEPPAQGQAAACDPASPDSPDADALTLTIHFRETRYCVEPEARNGLRLRADETRKEVAA